MNLTPCHPYELIDILEVHLKTPHTESTPLMLWGAPGIGKSQIVRTAAKNCGNLPLVDIRLSSLEPSDLMGLPFRTDDKMHFAKMSLLPSDPNSEGVLFIDEINDAPPAVSAIAYQLILDRRINDYVLPNGWRLVAAGNRTKDRGLARPMPAPLQNRFQHYAMEPSIKDLLRYFAENNLSPEVSGFLAFRPAQMFQFDPDNIAWASPRTWEKLARMLPHISNKITNASRLKMYQALVGSIAGTEFLGFQALRRELPTMVEIETNPKGATLPDTPAAQYATVVMLIGYAQKDNFEAVATYASRLHGDFQGFLFADLTKRKPTLTEHPAYQAIAVKHANWMANCAA